jgi:hypothetical protein
VPAPFVKTIKPFLCEEEAEELEPMPRPHEVLARRWKGRPPRPVWWALRQRVLERDNHTCVYCVTPVKGHHFSGEQSPASSGKGGMLNVLPATERWIGTIV